LKFFDNLPLALASGQAQSMNQVLAALSQKIKIPIGFSPICAKGIKDFIYFTEGAAKVIWLFQTTPLAKASGN